MSVVAQDKKTRIPDFVGRADAHHRRPRRGQPGSTAPTAASGSTSCMGIAVVNTGHCHPKVVKAVQEQAGKMIARADEHLPPAAHARPRRQALRDRARRPGPGACSPTRAPRPSRTPSSSPSRPRAAPASSPSRAPSTAARTSPWRSPTRSCTTAATCSRSCGGIYHARYCYPYRTPASEDPTDVRDRGRAPRAARRDLRRRRGRHRRRAHPGRGRLHRADRRVHARSCARSPTRSAPASSSTRSRPAWAAPASGSATSTTASTPTSSPSPRASPPATRWPPSSPATSSGTSACPGSMGGTYGGNAVACAAGVATIDVMKDEGMLDNAAGRATSSQAFFTDMQATYPAIGDVRGKGLMVAIECVKPGTKEPDAGRQGVHRRVRQAQPHPHGRRRVRQLRALPAAAQHQRRRHGPRLRHLHRGRQDRLLKRLQASRPLTGGRVA